MSLCLSRPVGRVVVVLALWALSALAASAQPPVTVTAADPPTGEQETVGLVVKVKGKNFAADARADFFRSGTSDPAGVTVTEMRFVSSTEVEATITIAAGAAVSLFDIRVTNLSSGRSGKGSDLFRVVEKGARAACTVEPLPANVELVTTLNTLVGGSPAYGPNLGVSAAMAPATLTFADSSSRTVLVAAVGTPVGTAKLEIFVLDATSGLPLDGTELCDDCDPQTHIQLDVPDGGGTWQLSSGELNGDDIPDFAVLTRNLPKAAMFLSQLLPSGQLVYSTVSLAPLPQYCCSDIAIGDLDDDEGDEIALSNLGGGNGKSKIGGRIHLYRVSGGTASLYHTLLPTGTVAAPGQLYGESLSIGDVTNDGHPDVVVGAPLRDVGGVADAGGVFVHEGGQGVPPNATPRALVPFAPVSGHGIGARIGVGDVHGVGVADVVTLTLWNPAAKGEVFPDLALISHPMWNFTPLAGLSAGWGTDGPAVGDINGDGRADVVVGAPNVTSGGNCSGQGMVYVFLAHELGGWTRYTIQAPLDADEALLGYSVAVANGFPFVLVGDNFRNLGSTVSAGQAFVYRIVPVP